MIQDKLLAVAKVVEDSTLHPKNLTECEALRVAWFGKEGIFRSFYSDVKQLEGDERSQVMQNINQLKSQAEVMLASVTQVQKEASLAAKFSTVHCDITLPAKTTGIGRIHPITQIEEEIGLVLGQFGFRRVDGPEVEEEYYCFDALNIPKHHPARDMQDTFYTDTQQVLRTHTTATQARELEKGKLPCKIACPGRVYRNESVDASHSDMFHQYEGLWVDQGITLPHLLSLLTSILKELYGKHRKIKFVPKFYPYTEPSIGALIGSLDGKGWVTVGGAGMVHFKVLEEFKFDPEKVSGIAFGLGTSRLVSERFGIPTMRALYDNDLRVLSKLV
jgi:phenylalanyl-tRNA synthetase alpha chain